MVSENFRIAEYWILKGILLELRARTLKQIYFLLQGPYFHPVSLKMGLLKLLPQNEAENCDFGLPRTLEYM